MLLRGLFIILLFQCAGEYIKISTDSFLPGSVIGMLLLFLALCCRGWYRQFQQPNVPESISHASQQLIGLLPLLFMPAAAGVFFLAPRFNQQWLPISVAVVAGTACSLLFNAWLMQRLLANEADRDS